MQHDKSHQSGPPPFRLCEIDHVVLRARDPLALANFYVGVLGCSRERVAGDLTQLRAGRALIDIVPRVVDDEPGRNVDHLCLTLDLFDAESLTRWFATHGILIGEVAMRYGAGGHGPSIYLTDPEGNGLELKGASA